MEFLEALSLFDSRYSCVFDRSAANRVRFRYYFYFRRVCLHVLRVFDVACIWRPSSGLADFDLRRFALRGLATVCYRHLGPLYRWGCARDETSAGLYRQGIEVNALICI